jgi:hypothetical protein
VTRTLRLEADDPDVRALTGLALEDAAAIPDPPLTIVCRRCGALLARAGDTGHGPLFTSWWESEPPLGHSITVNGRELNRRESIAWREQHTELVESRGRPMHAPLRHGVTALLTPGLADHPDLLVRCMQHGDSVLDRDEVLGWVRQAAHKPTKRTVVVSKPFSEYRVPQVAPGPTEHRHQREVRKMKLDAMPLEEFEARMRRRRDAET